MAGDDLNKPLGMEKPSPGAPRRRTLTLALAAGGCAVVAFGAGLVIFSANPHGGEPFAVATIPPPKPLPAQGPDRLVTGSIRAPATTPESAGSVENGVTVYRAAPTSEARTGPLVIKVPEALGQNDILPVDKRLVEMTRYGPLPKIGADGARASDIYARPPVFSGTIRAGAPRIAIIVSGLGLNAAETADAIDHTPAAVTLALAPYGAALDDAVKRAQAKGHEVMLQLPMESSGDGEAAPGPHALRADATPSQTIDDMHWLMSRMGGYVGLVNSRGPRFTADKAAMTTMLQETGARGLLYVDDGTSQRSLGPTLAPNLGVPAARADIALDAGTDPAALRAAFGKLETVARDKGTAIGLATGRPDMIRALGQFAQTLEAKGIVLVPVSAMASAAAPTLAATPAAGGSPSSVRSPSSDRSP